MKTMKKLLMTIFICLSVFVSFVGTVAVHAVAAPTANIRYKTYDGNQYEAYYKESIKYDSWSGWVTDLGKWYDILADKAKGGDTADGIHIDPVVDAAAIAVADAAWKKSSGKGDKVTAKNDESISAYEYYGNRTPMEILGNKTIQYYDDRTEHYVFHYPFELPEEKTDFVPGDRIAIEALMTSNGNKLAGGYVFIDISGFASNYNPTANDLFISQLGEAQKCQEYVDNYMLVGWNYITNVEGAKPAGEEYSLGAFAVTIDSSCNGSQSISMSGGTGNVYQNQNIYQYVDDGGNIQSFLKGNDTGTPKRMQETPGAFTVVGASDDPSLASIKVGSEDISSSLTGSTTDANGNINGGTYSKTGITGDAVVNVVVTSSGTSTLSYVNPDTGSVVNVTASGSNYTVPMSSLKPGQTVVATINTTSSDGTGHGQFTVNLTKKYDTTAELQNVVFNATAVSGSSVTIKKTDSQSAAGITSFDPSCTQYYVYIPQDTTALAAKPTYEDSKYTYTGAKNQELFFNGSTTKTASGANCSITNFADGDTFTMKVVAQDGTTSKTYTFTIRHAEIETNLSGISFTFTAPSQADGSDTVLNKNTAAVVGANVVFDPTTYTYTLWVPEDITSLTVTPTVNKSYLKMEYNSTTISTSFSPTSFANNATFTIRVQVNGGTSYKDYTFTIKHMDTDTDISNMYIKGTNDNVSIQYTLDAATSTWKAVSNKLVDYSNNNFTITASWSAYQTVKISYGTTVNQALASGSASPLIAFNTTGPSAYTETVTMTVKFQAGNTKTYTISVARDAASAKTEFTNIEVNGTGITSSLVANSTVDSEGNTHTYDAYFLYGFTGTSGAKIKGSVADNGKVTSIKYSATEAAATSGTSVTVTPSGSSYEGSIPASFISTVATGSKFYAAIEVVALDGTTTQTYLVIIEKAKDTSKKLNTVNFTVSGAASNNGWVLLNGTSVVKAFNTSGAYTVGSSNTYTLMFAADATSLTITTGFSGDKININGTEYTAATATNVAISDIANGDQIEIFVIAQDGSQTPVYTFNISRKSDVAKFDSISIKDDSGNELVTLNPDQVSITIANSGNLPYSTASLTATATALAGSNATVTIKVGSTTTSTISFTGNTATTKTFDITVSPESAGYFGSPVTIQAKFTRLAPNDDYSFNFTGDVEVDKTQVVSSDVVLTPIFDNNSAPVNVELKVVYNGDPYDLDYGTKTVTFTIHPLNSTSKVFIDGVDYTDTAYTWTLNQGVQKINQSKKIEIRTEKTGTGTGHQVTLKCITAQANSDASFGEIMLEDSSKVARPVLFNDTLQRKNPTQVDTSNKILTYTLVHAEHASGTYTLNAFAKQPTSKIYYSTNTGNLKQNEFDPASDTFNVETTYYITVYAQYGNYETWTIVTKWKDERNDNTNLASLTITNANPSGTPVSFTYNPSITDYDGQVTLPGHGAVVSVPYTTTQINIVATPDFAKATLTSATSGNVGLKTLNVGDNTYTFQVKAENEDEGKIYKVVVRRAAGQKDDSVETLTISNVDCGSLTATSKKYIYEAFNPLSHKNNTFDFVLPRNSSQAIIKFTVSLNAKFKIQYQNDSNTLASTISNTNNTNYIVSGLTPGSYTEIYIDVISEENSVIASDQYVRYTIRIYTANQNYDISLVQILGAAASGSITIDGDTYDDLADVDGNLFAGYVSGVTPNIFEIAYAAATPYIYVLPDDSEGKAYVNNVESGLVTVTAGQTKTITISVISEYQKLNSAKANQINQSTEYVIKIKRRQADKTCTLDELKIDFGPGVTATLSPAFNPSVTAYSISNIPDSVNSATVTYKTTSPLATVTGTTGDENGVINNLLTSSGSQVLTFTVTAESKAVKTYTVTLSRTVYQPSNNNTINNVKISEGNTVFLSTFINTTTSYTLTLPATTSTFLFAVTKADNLSSIAVTVADSLGTDLTSTNVNSLSETNHNISINTGQTIKVVLVCTSESGNAGTPYEFTITRDSYDIDSSASEIKINGQPLSSFGVTFDPSVTSYTVYVGNSVNTVTLGVTPNSSVANVTTNEAATAKNISVGTNRISTVVTAQDPSKTTTYTIDVVRLADDSLDELHIYDPKNPGVDLMSFTGAIEYKSITVDYVVDSIDFSAIAKGGSDVTIKTVVYQGSSTTPKNANLGSNPLAVGLNKFVVSVVLANGDTKDYTIEVTRDQGSFDALITKYVTEDGVEITLTSSVFDYYYCVTRNLNNYQPEATWDANVVVSPYATKTLKSARLLTPGVENIKEIEVVSQNGKTTNVYRFHVFPANQDFDIKNIAVLKNAGGQNIQDLKDSHIVDFDPTTLEYTIKVPYSTSNFYLKVELNDSFAGVKVNGTLYDFKGTSLTPLNEGDNIFKIQGVSEYGKLYSSATGTTSSEYTIKIVRENENQDPSLKELKVIIGGVEYTATQSDLDARSFIIENIGNSVMSISIDATPNNEATNITGKGNKNLDALSDSGGTVTGYTKAFDIVCTSADNPLYTTTYTVTVTRGKADLSGDTTITYIAIEDSNKVVYLDENTFSASTYAYTITIPYGAQSYTISVEKPKVSPSTIVGAGQFSVPSDFQTKTHTIYAHSQAGTDGTPYVITVKFEGPSSDATLADLKVNGVTITYVDSNGIVQSFNPNKLDYEFAVQSNSTTTISIEAFANDPLATITASSQVGMNLPLNVGTNLFKITVMAQNGDSKMYTVTVVRDYPNPYLTNMEIVNEKLLDTKDKVTTFDSEVLEYHAIVLANVSNVQITLRVQTSTDVVTCSPNAVQLTNSGLTRAFQLHLADGPSVNEFTINVTSLNGKAVSYKLIVQRRGAEDKNTNISKADIAEIPAFKDDYSNLTFVYDYEVENKVRNLTFDVICEKIADAEGDGAKFEVYNNKGLKVGENKVILLITAQDGETTRAIVINVTRKPMNFTVDTNATNFECTPTDEANVYDIKLKNNKASAIKDYTKYIQSAEEDNLVVKVLSDTTKEDCSEVIISVSDGSEERLVRFNLKTEIPPLVFTVNQQATEYECTQVDGVQDEYVIDLKDKAANAIKDYTKYIEYEDGENIDVKVISDTSKEDCKEVILSVSDGNETRLVKFQIKTTAGPTGNYNFIVWIILGVALLLLIIILICVNKDKYGAISKKRKRAR